MLTKFKNLIYPSRLPVDPITAEVDFHIKNHNWNILLSAVEAGYPLSVSQVNKCISIIGENYSRKFEHNRPTKDISTIENHLLQHHKTQIYNYIRPYLPPIVKHITNYEQCIAFQGFFYNNKFLDCLEENDLKNALNIIEKRRSWFVGSVNLPEGIQDYYQKRFVDAGYNLSKKINANYIKPVKSLLQDLPESVQLQVKMINQLVDQIDSSKLSDVSRAELNTLLEITLPKLVTQYAAIDESMLGFKNDKEQTVDDILTEGLKQVRNSLKGVAEQMEHQKIKELKITARQLSTTK